MLSLVNTMEWAHMCSHMHANTPASQIFTIITFLFIIIAVFLFGQFYLVFVRHLLTKHICKSSEGCSMLGVKGFMKQSLFSATATKIWSVLCWELITRTGKIFWCRWKSRKAFWKRWHLNLSVAAWTDVTMEMKKAFQIVGIPRKIYRFASQKPWEQVSALQLIY